MKRLFPIAIALLLPMAAFAKPVTFECKMGGATEGWITSPTYFEYDSAKQSVRVVDGVIMHFEKKPKRASISENTDKRLVFDWKVNVRVRGNISVMRYNFTYLKGKGLGIIQAAPAGYDNRPTGRGKCRQVNRRL